MPSRIDADPVPVSATNSRDVLYYSQDFPSLLAVSR